MKKAGVLSILFVVVLLAVAVIADAQQPKKVPRIGYLGNVASPLNDDIKPFRERLSELGYLEGQNLAIEYRYFKGKVKLLPALAAELVRLDCDVIYAIGNEAAEAAKNATKEIPIVISNTNDAVRSGFVASLARPGGNITGLTSMGGEIHGKRLELLKEIIPKLSRVGFLWSPTSPVAADNLKETAAAAKSLRIGIQSLDVKGPDDIERAFQAAVNKRAEALLVESGGFATAHQKQIIEQAAKRRLPVVYPNTRFVEAGGLMTYANDRKVQFRRAAEYVDKILKGTKPADLPVERPKKLELIINLQAAKQIGLTIPPNVLARADRVIK